MSGSFITNLPWPAVGDRLLTAHNAVTPARTHSTLALSRNQERGFLLSSYQQKKIYNTTLSLIVFSQYKTLRNKIYNVFVMYILY